MIHLCARIVAYYLSLADLQDLKLTTENFFFALSFSLFIIITLTLDKNNTENVNCDSETVIQVWYTLYLFL